MPAPGEPTGGGFGRSSRLEKVIIGLVVLVLAAVVAVIVVAVAGYDGRSAPEKREDEELAGPSSLAYCPGGEPSREDLPTGNHEQPRAVLPAGPANLLVCEYQGHRLYSEASQRTGRSAAERIAHELRIAPRDEPDLSCPPESPARLLAIFYYRGAPDVAVQVGPEGCRIAGAPGRPPVLASESTINRLRHHEGAHAEGSELPPE